MIKVLALQYVPLGLWKFGGSERHFAYLSRHMATYGVRIDAVEPKPSMSRAFSVGYNPVEVTVPFMHNVYVSLFAWFFLGLIKSIRLHSRNKYDLILATNNNVFNFGLGYLISRILKRPLVVVVHHLRWVNPCDPATDGRLRPLCAYRKMRQERLSRLGAFIQILGAVIESKVYKAKVCVVVSKAVLRNLRELGCKNEIVVTGNGVDLDYIRSFPGSKKRYDAIFVGRFDEGKGVLDLIKAWKSVAESLPKSQLVLVGTGTLYPEALQMSRDLALENNVVFTGFVEEEGLFSALGASRLFVSMSRTEGWGFAIAEALAKGLPVVCYNIPAIKEVFGGCTSVSLIEVGNKELFVKQVEHVLSLNESDPSYVTIEKSSIDYVKKFSWSDVSLKMYHALKVALRSG